MSGVVGEEEAIRGVVHFLVCHAHLVSNEGFGSGLCCSLFVVWCFEFGICGPVFWCFGSGVDGLVFGVLGLGFAVRCLVFRVWWFGFGF